MTIGKEVAKRKGYLYNILFIWGAFLIYFFLPYYQNFLRQDTVELLFLLATAYTIGGLIAHLRKPFTKTKGYFIAKSLQRITKGPYEKNKLGVVFPRLEKEEKTSLLFVLVKFFFLPIMLNFFFANANATIDQIPRVFASGAQFIPFFNTSLFSFLLALFFLIDTAWFAFGYTFESKKLKNKIRSVEPTFFGWAIALICYPPFNGIITKSLNWYANDYVLFGTELTTFIMRIMILLFLGTYVSATLALGAKSSNLTNRGIVSRGPYSIIRHPAYISKNLAWWLTIIPVATPMAIVSMAVWSTIYHFRSITEENHLKTDPDYVAYCKKVKYRYVPGLY